MDDDILINCPKCKNSVKINTNLYSKFKNEENRIREDARQKLIKERESYRIHLEHNDSVHKLELKKRNEEITVIREQLNKKNL